MAERRQGAPLSKPIAGKIDSQPTRLKPPKGGFFLRGTCAQECQFAASTLLRGRLIRSRASVNRLQQTIAFRGIERLQCAIALQAAAITVPFLYSPTNVFGRRAPRFCLQFGRAGDSAVERGDNPQVI